MKRIKCSKRTKVHVTHMREELLSWPSDTHTYLCLVASFYGCERRSKEFSVYNTPWKSTWALCRYVAVNPPTDAPLNDDNTPLCPHCVLLAAVYGRAFSFVQLIMSDYSYELVGKCAFCAGVKTSDEFRKIALIDDNSYVKSARCDRTSLCVCFS